MVVTICLWMLNLRKWVPGWFYIRLVSKSCLPMIRTVSVLSWLASKRSHHDEWQLWNVLIPPVKLVHNQIRTHSKIVPCSQNKTPQTKKIKIVLNQELNLTSPIRTTLNHEHWPRNIIVILNYIYMYSNQVIWRRTLRRRVQINRNNYYIRPGFPFFTARPNIRSTWIE